MTGRSAFSLIELLVVISIIAVLAAMLLPTIGTVKAMASQTACASQIRQIYLASVGYRGDNEGLYVPIYWNDPGWNTWSSWAVQPWQGRWQHFLEPYTETFTVFNCPVSLKLDPVAAIMEKPIAGYQRGTAIGGGPSGWCTALYAYNGKVFGQTKNNWGMGPMTDGKVNQYFAQRPGTDKNLCPMFMDGCWQTDLAYYNKPYTTRGVSSFPHRTRANMVYLDGHVENHAFSEITVWDPVQAGN